MLREWCCILELALEENAGGLHLIATKGDIPYRKHFLKLNGLGVRDLVRQENDLLILAGPSMAHDGPHEIWRWKGGATTSPSEQPRRILSLPQREGSDRAEAFCILEEDDAKTSILIVYDNPAASRLTPKGSVKMDVYLLK